LKKGDIINSINRISILRLRDLSDALKGLKAGDDVRIMIHRHGDTLELEAVVEER
jgi:S1-C subfamily serine protease